MGTFGAYEECYLDDAMRNMGELTEYVSEADTVEMDTFFRMFVISGLAEEWEKGNPKYLCGMSGTELHHEVMRKVGVTRETWAEPFIRYDTGDTYWCGWILAYYQWKSRKRFSDIISKMSFCDLLYMYPALHTASEERSYVLIEHRMADRMGQMSRLQEYRKRLGYTQRELANRADVNIRTLQQYEIGDKEIGKASADKVFRLARELHCRPEELVEEVFSSVKPTR